MALAHAAGIALSLLGVPLPWAPLLLSIVVSLFLLWWRPWPTGVLLMALVAGAASGSAHLQALARDCRLHLPPTWEGEVVGRFLTRPLAGATVPFRIESGGPEGCRAVFRAAVARDGTPPLAGARIAGTARWEGRAFPQVGQAEWAGRLRMAVDWTPSPGGGLPGAILALRGGIQERMVELWGVDSAPVVEALVLARREHLDPSLRQAFGLSGTAHLLAISGFHVGVVAALLFGLLRTLGAGRRSAEGGAAAGCWAYVLAIGAPHAAARAAVLLTLLVGARLRGRPVVPIGALGSALLLLLILNPGWLASVGFQLSFAGTGGLVLLRRPMAKGIEWLRCRCTGAPRAARRDRGLAADFLRSGEEGVAAGIAATLPTLPLLAWHFDRISLVGVPATLLLAPLVAAAIPGIAAALFASLVSLPLGRFLAGGSGLLLELVGRVVRESAVLPGASIWISRGALAAACVGGIGAYWILRRAFAGRVRRGFRTGAACGIGVAFVFLLPLLPLSRDLEVHVIDVGQGDAVALRFPHGRWILVDAGPRSAGFDAGERRILPYLRRQGVRRLEGIVLTHPHLDHIGGAPAILAGMTVRGILDPARPHGSRPYLEVLEAIGADGPWWWEATEGRGFTLDGARVEVLHPDRETRDAPLLPDPNDLSIVLLVEWGEARILLTGDAPAEVERRVLDRLGTLTLLKVGHHGSRTSTSSDLLDRTRPAIATIGVGDPNGFGHPHEEVMERLRAAGVTVYRTDRDGDLRIRIRADGSARVEPSR
ncbi:MAG: DNA internalization-related competence protein ComEC/Rec2 [Gemmatimonadota bacterium]